MYIKEFLKNLTISVRKREMVYWCLPILSIIYGIMPTQSLFFMNIIISIPIIVMLVLIGYDGIQFLRNIFPRKKSYPIDVPELSKLADKLDLELSPKPFWETEKKKILALSLGHSKKSNQIIFGKDFLTSLTTEERIFVGGHEFLHLYGREFWYYSIIFIPLLGLIFFLQSALIIPQNISIIGFLGATVGCICLGKRSFESIADINGAKNVNKENAINALKKAYAGKENKSFNLHPNLKDRINNLERYYKQKN